MTWYRELLMWVAMAMAIAFLCVTFALAMYAGYRDRWGK